LGKFELGRKFPEKGEGLKVHRRLYGGKVSWRKRGFTDFTRGWGETTFKAPLEKKSAGGALSL